MSADLASDFQESLSMFLDKKQVKGILQGTIKDIDGYNSCTVNISEGLDLFDVRLNAVLGSITDMATIKPKVGSKVLVALIENVKTEAFVVKLSEIEEMTIKIGTALVRVKGSRVKIESEGENLKDQLSALIGEVKKIIVLYGTGPNIPALDAIDLKIKKILD